MSSHPSSSPNWPAAIAAARADLAAGRPGDARDRLTSVHDDPTAPDEAVRLCASALRRLGLNAAALPLLQRLVHANPASSNAEHNLAAALGDLGEMAAAADAAKRALGKGGTAPETWLVLGRALQGQGRLAEAEAAFARSLSLRPQQIEARRDLAQLIWMRTGDAPAAMAPLDLSTVGLDLRPALAAIGAAAMIDMVGEKAAYDWLAPLLKTRSDAGLHLAAARAAGGFDPALALAHAQAATEAAPAAPDARIALATALVAAGRALEALPLLDAYIRDLPQDQYAVALRYTAWRVLSDPRALDSADYAALVRGYDLVAPDRIEAPFAWMTEAGQALARLHPFQAHPFDQSIRAGVQAPIDPRRVGEPVLDAVFEALSAPIDAYVASMAGRDDPMSRRASSDGWDMTGAWSVRLRAGGRHTDHVHPKGWVSSALHVVTPQPDPDAPRAGWLRFGAVRLGIGLSLEAEHWVEPRPGRVVLFPSWMWHGTEPFTADGERLTIAFDVQPRGRD
ncbi:MAG: tetratricopeptide repeat protein [Alphaproteobacteria bacterium]|nr:tetratricopeptide repeat protein [Alphaproteobacteria bacterium]MBU2378670.1 tetratricopeptide repeat protein [Alphaproteobacteria bacterium]